MSIRTHRWGVLGTAGILVAGGLLSGCGVSGEQPRPGVAAQVGETQVSLDLIDDSIEDACSFFSDQEQPGFPKSLARQQFVSILISRAAASQALAESDLALGDDFDQAVLGIDAANAQVPEAQRAPFNLLNEAATYVDYASRALGEVAFAAEGGVPADPAEVSLRGLSEISGWLDANEVEINPSFRLTVVDGEVVADGGTGSVAVSDYATVNLLDPLTATQEQVTAAVAELPASQVCGASSEG